MSEFRQGDACQVIWLVRRLFRSLAQESNEQLAEFGITAADRAVREFLHPDAELSVPQIAGRYQVSRQHVQVTANALLEKGLLEALENPRHRRSPLLRLNDEGRALFSRVLANDRRAVETLFSGLSARNLAITRRTLQTVLNDLDGELPP